MCRSQLFPFFWVVKLFIKSCVSVVSDLNRENRDQGDRPVCQNNWILSFQKLILRLKHLRTPIFLRHVNDSNRNGRSTSEQTSKDCMCVSEKVTPSLGALALPSPTWFSKGGEFCSARGSLQSCCGSGRWRSRWNWSQTLGRPKTKNNKREVKTIAERVKMNSNNLS